MPRYAGRESQKSVGSWSYSLSFYTYILRVDLLGGNFEDLFGCGYDPLVGWVVMEVPNAFRTCHDVEIVGFVSVRDNHWMVTPRHEDDIAVLDGHGIVKVTRVAVDAVEDKTL